MLYTESMEMASPLLVREIPQQQERKQTLSDLVKNRVAKPRLDLGICMGSESFAVCTGTKSISHPARAAIRESNGRVVALGAQAEEIEGREPEGVVVVRPIQGGIVADARLASRLMANALSASKHGLVSAPKVALAVPAGLSAVESQMLLATAKRAGAREVYLVDKGLAAAIGAGRDLLKPEGNLVVHIGAGATQVTVCSLAGVVISRGLRVAGSAMTEALQEYIRREHNLLVDFKIAQQVKHQLGSALEPFSDSEMHIVGRELGVGKPVEKVVTAREVYRVLNPYLQEIAQQARLVVAEMSPELLIDVHRNGVVLSGGSAQLSRLDEFLAEECRLRVSVAKEPAQAVARGLQRLLGDSPLRRAVFHHGKGKPTKDPSPNHRGTGLLGALLLTAALAFSANSAPQLQQGAATTLDHYLSGLVTPSVPMAEGWGWHSPDAVNTAELEARRRDQLERENARLRSLLNAPDKKKGPSAMKNCVVADVVARDPRGWLSTLTLNVGSEQGIRSGMTVSDGTNLVGQVYKVQKERCQVRLFTDAKAVVAGKLEGRQASGVVVGSGEYLVEMRYLDPDSGVKKGDYVLTSGHDGVFPAGMVLGVIQRIQQPAEKNYLAAIVKPAVDFANLENVVVLKG